MFPLGGLPVLETQSLSKAFFAFTSVQLIDRVKKCVKLSNDQLQQMSNCANVSTRAAKKSWVSSTSAAKSVMRTCN